MNIGLDVGYSHTKAELCKAKKGLAELEGES